MLIATTHDAEGSRARCTDWAYDSFRHARTVLEEDDASSIMLLLERQRATWQIVAMRPSENAWRELEATGLFGNSLGE